MAIKNMQHDPSTEDVLLRFISMMRADLIVFIRCKLGPRRLGGFVSPEDIFQDLAVEATRRAASIKFSSEPEICSWIWKLAGWTVSDTVRRHRAQERGGRARRHEGLLSGSYAHLWSRLAGEPSTSDLSKEELEVAVRSVVASLPVKEREVIMLHEIHEVPARKIAILIGDTERAVASVLHRAHVKLRQAIRHSDYLRSRWIQKANADGQRNENPTIDRERRHPT